MKSLGLHGLLAKHLPLGTIEDQLLGIKSISEETLRASLDRFISEVPQVVIAGWLKLKSIGSASSAESMGGNNTVQEHMNSKFALDGAFVGKFATLDDYYKGPEGLIGIPNYKIRDGMEAEHCKRGNHDTSFTADNYNVTTSPAMEWEFVVNPQDGVQYPHTPKDKSKWPKSCGWKGACGREVQSLAMFMDTQQVVKAGLGQDEVVGLRLYTGPMFVLYNAVLRGFPEKYVKCLKDKADRENRYETTIFVIASGITKLSKITVVPKDRRLYRGLGGMILPRQFWERYPESQITFAINTSKDRAPTVLKQLNEAIYRRSASESTIGLDNFVKGDMKPGPRLATALSTNTQKLSALADDKSLLPYPAPDDLIAAGQLGPSSPGSEKVAISTVISEITEHLMIELPAEFGEARKRGVRVIKEARIDSEGAIRMSVAVAVSKWDFEGQLRSLFLDAVQVLCGSEHDVWVEEVADKPVDFQGGGTLID